ncbi:general odorant-binding protein 28a-like [Sitodiplosis mosellana]|uniref:general odorant-binding protein 28a-like n=1 Tax=Sitodiplosis mosellana TaxID=263140 RepID=UPI002444E00F|nr:general odorant-binding protein 28a-like [Sitodiplosis mosellana]
MKSFIVLVVVCCAIGLSESLSKEQRKEMFYKVANECATKEGGSSADVDEIAAHKPASTKGGKCVRACIFEAVGIMKNNQVDVESTANVAAMAFDGDAAKVSAARDLATACASVTDADRCEAAFKIMACGRDSAKGRGISFADL